MTSPKHSRPPLIIITSWRVRVNQAKFSIPQLHQIRTRRLIPLVHRALLWPHFLVQWCSGWVRNRSYHRGCFTGDWLPWAGSQPYVRDAHSWCRSWRPRVHTVHCRQPCEPLWCPVQKSPHNDPGSKHQCLEYMPVNIQSGGTLFFFLFSVGLLRSQGLLSSWSVSFGGKREWKCSEMKKMRNVCFHGQSFPWVIGVRRDLLGGAQCPQADCKATSCTSLYHQPISVSSVNSIRLFQNILLGGFWWGSYYNAGDHLSTFVTVTVTVTV